MHESCLIKLYAFVCLFDFIIIVIFVCLCILFVYHYFIFIIKQSLHRSACLSAFICMHLFVCLYAFIYLFVIFVCLRLFVCIYLFVCLPLLKTITVQSQFNDTFALLCVCVWMISYCRRRGCYCDCNVSLPLAVPLSSSLYGRNSRVWDRLYFERHFRKIFCIPLYSWLKLWVTMLNKWYIYIYIEYAQCTSRRVQNWSFWFFCLFYKSYPR